MKYLQITPATSTEPGLCVQPTMEKPDYPNGNSDFYEYLEWKDHITGCEKLPTTCTLPAGEWFEGRETNEVFSPDTSNWTEEDWKEAQAEAQRELPQSPRKVIVPVEQKEEKDLATNIPDGDGYEWTIGSETFTRKEVFKMLYTQRAMISNDIKQLGIASTEVLDILENPRTPKI